MGMCVGHKKDGSPCGNHARTGGTVCNSHGGKARQVRAKAAENVATEQARAAVRKLTIAPIEDPLTELLKLAGEITALKDHLRGEVERLEQLRYKGVAAEQIRGELSAYQAALRDTVSVLAVIGRLGIDDRLVHIKERESDIVLAAIDAALAAAGVERGRWADAKRAAARHLQVVS